VRHETTWDPDYGTAGRRSVHGNINETGGDDEDNDPGNSAIEANQLSRMGSTAGTATAILVHQRLLLMIGYHYGLQPGM
jgi:hypothetical protein